MAPIRTILTISAAATCMACGSAYADRIALPVKPRTVEIVEQKAPYVIDIIAKDGTTVLATSSV